MNAFPDEAPLAGQRIGLFGKGGSGKSTVTVMLARALRHRGYPVVVLDADSSNIGLGAALGADNEPDPLLDFFGGMVFSGGAVTCPVDDPTPLEGAEVVLESLPARFVARCGEGIHLLSAGKLGGLGPGAGCDGPVAKIARDLRVTSEGRQPVTVLDFKAGFEDAARGVITSLDWLIGVVDPTTASIHMAKHMGAMVGAIRSGVPPATRHLERPELAETMRRLFRETRLQEVFGVLNRVDSPVVEAHLRSALSRTGIRTLAVFPRDPDIDGQWLQGQKLDSPPLEEAGRTLVAGMEAALSTPAGADQGLAWQEVHTIRDGTAAGSAP